MGYGFIESNCDTTEDLYRFENKSEEEERLQNMENAFVNSQSFKGLEIGIIDNVLTTGVKIYLSRNS